MSKKRAWAVVADGVTVRRLVGMKDERGNWVVPPEVEKLSARITANSACFIFPCEPEEYDAERLEPDKETGRLKWNKIKRTRWVRCGPDRDFMPSPHPGDVPESDWRPGLWAEAFGAAGDALVAYLKEHPRP